MFSRQLTSEFAIVAILCAAAVLFFPAVRGPYSAVHGPVTALRSTQTRLKMWLVMALAALHILGGSLAVCRFLLPALFSRAFSFRSSPPGKVFFLRC
jgi:hypothetical protein